jgi:hypothetical protein
LKLINNIYLSSFVIFVFLIVYELIYYKDIKQINDFFLKTIIYFTFPVVLIPVKELLPILLEIYKNYNSKENLDETNRKKSRNIKQ